MLKDKRKLTIFGLLALTLAATTALAGPKIFGHDDNRRDRFVRFMVEDTLDDLEATDAQRQAIWEVVTRAKAEMKAEEDKRQKTHATAKALLSADNPDSQAVHEFVEQQSARVNDKMHAAADYLLEVHAILTPEQRAQLLERMEKMKAHHRGHGPFGH